MATEGEGEEIWAGGFEPFGRDWREGLPEGAQENGIFLRFPGQWFDEVWREASLGEEGYYNVHRWYGQQQGRYWLPDPLAPVNTAIFNGSASEALLEAIFGNAWMNPVIRIDSLGLRSRVCCRKIPKVPAFHCFIQIERDGRSTTCGLHGGRFSPGEQPKTGEIRKDKIFDQPNESTCGPWNESCQADDCVIGIAGQYANPSRHRAVRGPNSNTFAGTIAEECDLRRPDNVGWTRGWNNKKEAPLKKDLEPEPSPCTLP